MKNLFTVTLGLLITLSASFALSSFTHITPEYYEGKWEVTVFDTPQGTATIPMRFETEEGITKGFFIEDASGTEKEMTSVTITGDNLVAYFNIAGYDVYISMVKKDSDVTSGSLMDMFTAEGKRV
ncbi:hypothetical protein MMU07_13430 [Aquiflexum sp. LQ15W]|uniref:hypothetical protein n=1 Tax=Cognataquiflexum nitidum TaxID=2922272 RepID=UPI001F144341|nr:hypothetical protein [Cognataquiflexum nitidum]MCH6200584.1 hypothetical protein [Cognataquiflexum nitidum]